VDKSTCRSAVHARTRARSVDQRQGDSTLRRDAHVICSRILWKQGFQRCLGTLQGALKTLSPEPLAALVAQQVRLCPLAGEKSNGSSCNSAAFCCEQCAANRGGLKDDGQPCRTASPAPSRGDFLRQSTQHIIVQRTGTHAVGGMGTMYTGPGISCLGWLTLPSAGCTPLMARQHNSASLRCVADRCKLYCHGCTSGHIAAGRRTNRNLRSTFRSRPEIPDVTLPRGSAKPRVTAPRVLSLQKLDSGTL